jgi:Tfp pilus assembly protein PilO
VSPRRNSPTPAGGRSTNRAVIAMAVMGALVLFYGWNSFFLAPRSRAKAAVAKQLATAQNNEQELRQSLAQLRKLADNTKAREAELARFATLVPSDPDLPGAILTLNDTARQAGVQWSSFTPGSPAPNAGGGPVTLSITMHIGGTFGQVYDYLHRLETLDRLVVVDSLQLAGGGNNGQSKLDAEVRARMFAAGTGSPPATTVAAGTAGGGTTGSTSAGSTSPATLVKAGG